MGLAERRVAKDFQENEYPQFLEELNETVGKELPVEMDWSALQEEGRSHLYKECWLQVYFEPLLAALKGICADDMGKEAIEEGLTKVVVTNDGSISNSGKWARFEGKVLTLNHKPCTNIGQIEDRAKTVQTLLESNL